MRLLKQSERNSAIICNLHCYSESGMTLSVVGKEKWKKWKKKTMRKKINKKINPKNMTSPLPRLYKLQTE